jgi:hypothetical protein
MRITNSPQQTDHMDKCDFSMILKYLAEHLLRKDPVEMHAEVFIYSEILARSLIGHVVKLPKIV